MYWCKTGSLWKVPHNHARGRWGDLNPAGEFRLDPKSMKVSTLKLASSYQPGSELLNEASASLCNFSRKFQEKQFQYLFWYLLTQEFPATLHLIYMRNWRKY